MPSLGQQFRVGYHIVDPVLGWDMDLPAFTCCHCNRVVSPGLSRLMREKASAVMVNAAVADWKRGVGVCRSCDMFMCRFCAAVSVDGECYSIYADAERAFEDKWKQPWMLRAFNIPELRRFGAEPVYRLLDKDGNVTYALQRDVGYTERQMNNLAGELNYNGSAKRKSGEQAL